MRIVQTVVAFYPAISFGGPVPTAFHISRHLVKQGHQVTVVCTNLLDKQRKLSSRTVIREIEGITVIYCNSFFLGSYGATVSYDSIGRLREALQDCDILHIHGYRNYLSLVASLYARRYSIPYVVHPQGTVPPVAHRIFLKRVFDRLIGLRLLSSADAVVAMTEIERETHVDFGLPRYKTRIIHSGLNLLEFESLPPKNTFRESFQIHGKYIVTYLGRLHKRKGLEFLMHSFARMRVERDTILVIAGSDDGYFDTMENLAKQLELGDSILFTGELAGESKFSLLVDSDVVVYPAEFEYFGLVPLEAMMCGTPVIVTDDAGCGEMAIKTGGAYRVRFGDVEGLCQQMCHILDHPSEARAKAVLGREFIKSNLSWVDTASQFESLYSDILQCRATMGGYVKGGNKPVSL